MVKKERTVKKVPQRHLNCDLTDPIFHKKPKEGYGYVYKYTFKNGMSYIGQTIRTIAQRTRSHLYNTGLMLVDSFIKSGAQFEVEILSECNIEYLDSAESYCILKFKTLHPNGYNLKMSPVTFGNTTEFTTEMRKKIGLGVRKRFEDPEFRNKIKENRKRYRKYNEKSIICLETKEVYKNIKEAAMDLNCNRAIVNLSLTKGYKAKGYHFMYFSRYVLDNTDEVLSVLNEWEDTRKKIRSSKASKQISITKRKKSLPIICLEKNKRYDTIMDASDDLGLKYNIIHAVCNGNKITKAGGYHFIWDFGYNDKDLPLILECIKDWEKERWMIGVMKKKGKLNEHTSISVRCVETNELFRNMNEASKRFDCSVSLISACCNGRIKSAKGYCFEKVIV